VNESDIRKTIQMALVYDGAILHRNNVGLFYTRNGSPIKIGVPGASDLIGWRTFVVTPEMVGHSIAAYMAVEVKSKRGRLTGEQENFINAVVKAGGIAFYARSVEEAKDKLGRWSLQWMGSHDRFSGDQ